MRDLYDQLTRGGGAAVAQLASERRQEGIDLEFKTKANSGNGIPDADDKQNLGITLSAFSNSMGGLLVWGVEAKKNSDGVDCATKPSPIKNIERFKNEITRLISQAIMPRHDGIFVEAIPAAVPPGAGYLVVYVERSDRRPHRCEAGSKQYFKRIGDSSIAMEHYDIEDSFRRLAVPSIDVGWSLRDGGHESTSGGSIRFIMVDLSLKNLSHITARFPYLIIDKISGATLESDHPRAGIVPPFSRRVERGALYFSGNANEVVHPGLWLTVATLRVGAPVQIRQDSHLYMKPGTLKPVIIDYRCGCQNSLQTVGQFTIPPEELQEIISDVISY